MNASLHRTVLRWPRFALFGLLASASLTAQPLTNTLCAVGSPFNIRPTFSPYGGNGIPLVKRTIDTVAYPEAKCNDDSPAVMYIRPANAAFNNNPIVTESSKWLIFLDGGAGCRNADACLYERWCSGGSQVFDRAGKMSSLGAWAAIVGTGIFSDNPVFANQFLDYNVVLVHYCSSDNWIGSQDYVSLLTTLADTYDIRFQGEAIVNAVFDTLLAGPTAPDADVALGYYATPLPDLSDASVVLLGGESAGGGGMRHHMDRLHFDVLLPVMNNPDVDIRGVIDAGHAPGMWDPAITWPAAPDPTSYSDFLTTQMAPGARTFWGAADSALDQSCLDPAWAAAHVADGGTHPDICLDTTYTLMNHITTAVFIRQDINDPLAVDPYVMWSLYPTTDDYWLAQFNQLTDFGTYTSAVGGHELPLGDSGVHAPKCNQHVAIQTNKGFFRHRVAGPGVPARSFHDLLVNWINGVAKGADTVQIQADNLGAGLYSPSFCP